MDESYIAKLAQKFARKFGVAMWLDDIAQAMRLAMWQESQKGRGFERQSAYYAGMAEVKRILYGRMRSPNWSARPVFEPADDEFLQWVPYSPIEEKEQISLLVQTASHNAIDKGDEKLLREILAMQSVREVVELARPQAKRLQRMVNLENK